MVHGTSEIPVKEIVGPSHEPTTWAVNAEKRSRGANRVVAWLVWVDSEDEDAARKSRHARSDGCPETSSSWPSVGDHHFDDVVIAGVFTSMIRRLDRVHVARLRRR